MKGRFCTKKICAQSNAAFVLKSFAAFFDLPSQRRVFAGSATVKRALEHDAARDFLHFVVKVTVTIFSFRGENRLAKTDLPHLLRPGRYLDYKVSRSPQTSFTNKNQGHRPARAALDRKRILDALTQKVIMSSVPKRTTALPSGSTEQSFDFTGGEWT